MEGVLRSFIQLCPRVFGTTDVEEGGWIQAFSRPVHLNVDKYDKIYHYPIHEFPFTTIPRSLTRPLKSIHFASNLFQNWQISDLLHSSLFLEDLSSSGRTIGKEDPDTDGPSSNFRLRPHLPVPSTSSYSKRWNTSSVGYCAHKTVSTSESSNCRGLRRMAFCG